jgi:hypothetical protein
MYNTKEIVLFFYNLSIVWTDVGVMKRTFEGCNSMYVDNIKNDLTAFEYELIFIGSGYRQWLSVVLNVMTFWGL